MKIELTEKELQYLHEWFVCYRQEGSVSKEHQKLYKKLEEIVVVVRSDTK